MHSELMGLFFTQLQHVVSVEAVCLALTVLAIYCVVKGRNLGLLAAGLLLPIGYLAVWKFYSAMCIVLAFGSILTLLWIEFKPYSELKASVIAKLNRTRTILWTTLTVGLILIISEQVNLIVTHLRLS